MRSDDMPLIRDLPLFRSMDDSSFEEMAGLAYLQRFPQGVDLITEGDPADFLHVVVDGSVELFAGWNDREASMAVVVPVNTFILAAVIRDSPYLMSGRTLEASRLLLIPAEVVRKLFRTDSGFSRAIVDELAGCYRGLVRESKNLKLRSSIERLANYLLAQQRAQGEREHVTLRYEKRVLASLLGMTPENLSRAFATLRPYGVEVDGRTVRLSKPRDLRVLAKPSPLIDGRGGDWGANRPDH